MSLHNALRRSYEARVLVVPLGDAAHEIVDQLTTLGLEGVRMLTEGPAGVATRALGGAGWTTRSQVPPGEIAAEVDTIVFVGSDLTAVPLDLVHEVCTAAHEAGRTSAAVLLEAKNWEQAEGGAAMRRLRSDVDMVVSVQDVALVAALIDVLRGGSRGEAVEAAEVPA